MLSVLCRRASSPPIAAPRSLEEVAAGGAARGAVSSAAGLEVTTPISRRYLAKLWIAARYFHFDEPESGRAGGSSRRLEPVCGGLHLATWARRPASHPATAGAVKEDRGNGRRSGISVRTWATYRSAVARCTLVSEPGGHAPSGGSAARRGGAATPGYPTRSRSSSIATSPRSGSCRGGRKMKRTFEAIA
jgi:hypothetical protein